MQEDINKNNEADAKVQEQQHIEQLLTPHNINTFSAILTKWLDNSATSVKYVYWGSVIERIYMLLITLFCLGCIVLLAIYNFLDKASAGTLIGAVIGYAMAKRIDEK